MPQSAHSFESIKKTLDGGELLIELFDDVVDCSHRYYESALNYMAMVLITKLDSSRPQRKSLEARDEARRLTHNSLCDKLRVLARTANEAGKDISWWEGITGRNEDRHKIGRWALKQVSEKLKQQAGGQNA